MWWAPWATLGSPGHIVPFRVLCAVRTRLWTLWWFRCTLFCVQLFASRALSRCKHDVGALSQLNAEIVERVPTPHFGRLKRCSAYGLFFGRLQYMHHLRYKYINIQEVSTSCNAVALCFSFHILAWSLGDCSGSIRLHSWSACIRQCQLTTCMSCLYRHATRLPMLIKVWWIYIVHTNASWCAIHLSALC